MTTNVITQYIELFDLLPTTPLYKWCIAADYIQEEQDIETTANTFREGTFILEVIESSFAHDFDSGGGDGRGFGYGYGNSVVCGRGDGRGRGFGFGDSYVCGFGDGRGWCYGINAVFNRANSSNSSKCVVSVTTQKRTKS